jgi:hypothetical protein
MTQKESLQVKADYISGEENQVTDSISRLEIVGDYSLQSKVFWKAVRHLKIQTDVDFLPEKQITYFQFMDLYEKIQGTKTI